MAWVLFLEPSFLFLSVFFSDKVIMSLNSILIFQATVLFQLAHLLKVVIGVICFFLLWNYKYANFELGTSRIEVAS